MSGDDWQRHGYLLESVDPAMPNAAPEVVADTRRSAKRRAVEAPLGTIQVFAKSSGPLVTVACVPTTTVCEFKAAVHEKGGPAPESQRLHCGGRPVEDGTMESNGVGELSTVLVHDGGSVGGAGSDARCDCGIAGGTEDCECKQGQCCSQGKAFGGVVPNAPYLVVSADKVYTQQEAALVDAFVLTLVQVGANERKRQLARWSYKVRTVFQHRNRVLRQAGLERAQWNALSSEEETRVRAYLLGDLKTKIGKAKVSGAHPELTATGLAALKTAAATPCTCLAGGASTHRPACLLRYTSASVLLHEEPSDGAVFRGLLGLKWLARTKATPIRCCACHLDDSAVHVVKGRLQLKPGARAKSKAALARDQPVNRAKVTRMNGVEQTNPQLWGERQVAEAERVFTEQLNSAASRVEAEDKRRMQVVQDAKAALQDEVRAVGADLSVANELNAVMAGRLEASQVREEHAVEEKDRMEARLVEVTRMYEKKCVEERRARTHAKLDEEMRRATVDTELENAALRADRDALVDRYSLKGWQKKRAVLTKAYLKHWGEDQGGDVQLTLGAVEKICEAAGCPDEYTRIEAMCSNGKRRGLTKSGEKTAQQSHRERAVVANWVLSLEVTNQRASVLQTATAEMSGKVSAKTEQFLAGAGLTTSVRQKIYLRKTTVAHYHQLLEAKQAEWLKAVSCGKGLVCGWLDDYTVFRIHHSMQHGSQRAINHYMTSVCKLPAPYPSARVKRFCFGSFCFFGGGG